MAPAVRVGIWELNLTFTPKDNHEHLCWKQEHSTHFKMENLRSQVKWRHGKRGGSSGVYPGNLSGKRTAADSSQHDTGSFRLETLKSEQRTSALRHQNPAQ